MAKETFLDDERNSREKFSTQYAEKGHREWMQELWPRWKGWNADFFSRAMKSPHIDFGHTAARSLGHCKPLTGYGSPVLLLLNEGLVFGTNRDWVVKAKASGHRRFISDLLCRLTVQQYVLEVLGTAERGNRGHGPLFTEHANRIGLVEGLAPVLVRRRNAEDEGQPIACGWPFCVRPDNYYGDDVTEELLDLARGAPRPRISPLLARPSLGAWELVLFLLGAGRTEDLSRLAAGQVDRLPTLRRRRNPVLARFERGEEEEDSTPISGKMAFDKAWLLWNGGTVRSIAEGILAYRDFSYMPILADALEEAGCGDDRVLRHLRARTKGHDSRCFVLRGLLGPKSEEAELW